jgi:hypothetical protein
MRHAFRFPSHVRSAVRDYIHRVVTEVEPGRFRQEPAYVIALLSRLQGVAYEGPDGFVKIGATSIDSVARGAAESWSGADMAITAEIQTGDLSITKAILAQAKLGGLEDIGSRERERLIGQIRNMRRFTRSPKVLFVREIDGRREPQIVSGTRLVQGPEPLPVSLPDYFVRRVLTTLDGDTRPNFVTAVQESSLRRLHLLARLYR